MKRIATHTLGCKLNFAETSAIVRQFVAAGWQAVDFHQPADLYVVNTCTVTAIAEKKCRNVIRQAIAQNPGAQVAVVGCFAQNSAEQISKMEGVDYVVGNNNKHRLLEIVEKKGLQKSHFSMDVPEMPTTFDLFYSMGDRTRTFFKIQDGCDYFCAYCAIPRARGRSRSATIRETMLAAREIAAAGAKEVVLTGVNTGTFGQQHGENLLVLLRQLDELDGIERFRISSIEPNLLTNEIVDFVAQSRHFAHHFHLPLQAGSDKVLKLMRRRYDTAFFANKLAYIKSRMPEAFVAADLMVGFHGEDEETFEQSRHYVESLPLSSLHVFPYSERPFTAAIGIKACHIGMAERQRRSVTMHLISEHKKRHFYASQAGTRQKVLWEDDKKEGRMFGFTDNYLRVSAPYDPTKVNTLQEVTLNDTFHDDVFQTKEEEMT
ncbi:MAG: tRNA (N(6)-L-threonylcarbamoyladenosine(37)-C(2))-methylthiotransferase MtaB [Bacteroidales bacterium]|nr:tRNA (N(6)-L-threonylcarbamoyladenosine(37)-C(2))-methylthiotransferase MtaB [Bacteroidales bacterium]